MNNVHRCGGNLLATRARLVVRKRALQFAFWVPALRCDKCRERLVERDTLVALEKASTAYPHTITYRAPRHLHSHTGDRSFIGESVRAPQPNVLEPIGTRTPVAA